MKTHEFIIKVRINAKPSQVTDDALQSLCDPIRKVFAEKLKLEEFVGNVLIVRGSIVPKDNGIDYTIPTFD